MRGGYSGQPDRRFSSGSTAGSPIYGGSTTANTSTNNSRGGRGHFQNLQWTASGGTRGGKQPDTGNSHQSSRETSVQSSGPPPPPPSAPKDPAPPHRPKKIHHSAPASRSGRRRVQRVSRSNARTHIPVERFKARARKVPNSRLPSKTKLRQHPLRPNRSQISHRR